MARRAGPEEETTVELPVVREMDIEARRKMAQDLEADARARALAEAESANARALAAAENNAELVAKVEQLEARVAELEGELERVNSLWRSTMAK